MKEIQGQLGLREEAIPQVNWKLFVGTAKAAMKWFLKVQMAHSAALQ